MPNPTNGIIDPNKLKLEQNIARISDLSVQDLINHINNNKGKTRLTVLLRDLIEAFKELQSRTISNNISQIITREVSGEQQFMVRLGEEQLADMESAAIKLHDIKRKKEEFIRAVLSTPELLADLDKKMLSDMMSLVKNDSLKVKIFVDLLNIIKSTTNRQEKQKMIDIFQ